MSKRRHGYGPPRTVRLQLPADAAWAPLAQKAAENGARVFGLDEASTPRLVMAVEELLLYLAHVLPGKEVALAIREGGTHVAAEATFAPLAAFASEAAAKELSLFNITAGSADLDSNDPGGMPLLLASRMTDGFHLDQERGTTRISLRVERKYPLVEPGQRGLASCSGELSVIAAPDPALVAEVCVAARGLYPAHLVPVWFATPGKVADMLAAGDLQALFVQDQSGAPCGMICWDQPSPESVSFYGPYSLVHGEEAVSLLLREFLAALGRSPVKTVYGSLVPCSLAAQGFEHLGTVPFHMPQAQQAVALPVWYRQLREDLGATVWSPPELTSFLEQEYARLLLPRDIRVLSQGGQQQAGHSVFATNINHELGEALLRPLLPGADAAQNVAQHVASLRREGLKNILFSIDLSSGWQAELAGPLLASGLAPVLLIPHGGQSDVVIFAYDESAS